MKRISILLAGIMFIISNTDAQSSFESGFLPSININSNFSKDRAIIFKAESRQQFFKEDLNYEYVSTDISAGLSKKLSINTTVAFGYLLRVDNTGIGNRAFQQITFIRRYGSFNLSHRLLADQTFKKNESAEYRMRYRVSSEIPLEGQSADPNEFFIKLNNEYLNSLQDRSYDLEIRGASLIGYVISPALKIEFGPDYRVNSFINGNTRNRLWLGLNIFWSI